MDAKQKTHAVYITHGVLATTCTIKNEKQIPSKEKKYYLFLQYIQYLCMNVSECICFCYFHNWLRELAQIQGIVHICYNYKYCLYFF